MRKHIDHESQNTTTMYCYSINSLNMSFCTGFELVSIATLSYHDQPRKQLIVTDNFVNRVAFF